MVLSIDITILFLFCLLLAVISIGKLCLPGPDSICPSEVLDQNKVVKINNPGPGRYSRILCEGIRKVD
jgi:hypothetical protein